MHTRGLPCEAALPVMVWLIPTLALRCAKLHVADPKSDSDALIAAMALVHGMIIVTRNISDFDEFGAELLNPWE